MIYSASQIWAEFKTGNDKYYLYRQLLFFGIGTVMFIVAAKIPFEFWKKHANKLFIIGIVSLILVLIPGIGIVRGGARSWIGIGDFSVQPAELMKIVLIIFTAKFLSNEDGIMSKNKYFFSYLFVILVIFGLIMLQPDFGTGIILMMSILLMLFVSLLKYKNIVLGLIAGVIGFAGLIISAPYRLERITSFLNPWSDPQGSGFQIIQSLYAISPSSLFGYGLFNSKQKYFFLPEPQTDFIFAIVCEELGLIGGIVIISLFLFLVVTGYKLCIKLKDSFAMNLVFGFTSLLAIQVFINIGVVIGLLPVTGVTLPFLSYGGSSFVITLFMMGIIVNIMNRKDLVEDSFYRIKKVHKFKKIEFKLFKKKKPSTNINL